MNILFWMSTSFQTTSRHLLIAILDELTAAGNHVTVLKKKVDAETEDLPEELAGRDIQCISIPVTASNKSNLIARYLKDVEYINKCRKYLDTSYDAVFVQSSNVAGLVFRVLHKKQPKAIKTFNVQDTFPQNTVFSGTLSEKSIPYRLLKFVQSYAYKNSDHIITISEDMKELLVSDCGVEPSKVEVIYNWSYGDKVYDSVDFNTEAVSELFRDGYFNAVYAGNIGMMQNVDVIIEAAKILKENTSIWFHIIGNGVYRDKLQAKAQEYGIKNISFLPMQPAELAPSIYGLAGVNIIPLKQGVYKTALPSKTATCMACQRPIVFAIGKTSVFGKRVAEETGCLLVDSDDAKELADAITMIESGNMEVNTSAFFYKNMTKTDNSRRYAEIIMGRKKL